MHSSVSVSGSRGYYRSFTILYYRVSLKKCPMFGRLKYVTFIRFKTTFTAINSSRGSAGTNLWPTHIQKCFVWFGLAMEDDIINAKQEGEVQT